MIGHALGQQRLQWMRDAEVLAFHLGQRIAYGLADVLAVADFGWSVPSARPTVVRRLCGQESIGPSGVFDQSRVRTCRAIAPSPGAQG